MKLRRDLRRAAHIALKRSLGFKPEEKLVIITDLPCQEIGQAFFQEATRIGPHVILIEIIPPKEHSLEPPPIIRTILKDCDLFIIPTSKSLTHTKARRDACLYGARGITLPGITSDVFIRTIPIDYVRLARTTMKLAEILTRTRVAQIKTNLGTDLELDLNHRTGHADTGMAQHPGSFSNLPAGEAYIAPISAKGVLVIDGSIASIGRLKRPIVVTVKDGRAQKIEGDNRRLQKILFSFGPSALTLGEFGIGTNQKARITGNILEDEKALGTVHIGFGDNIGFGGDNAAEVHIDCLIQKPNLVIDGKTIMTDGNIII